MGDPLYHYKEDTNKWTSISLGSFLVEEQGQNISIEGEQRVKEAKALLADRVAKGQSTSRDDLTKALEEKKIRTVRFSKMKSD